jgi:Leucine-rich repeat (LRR) protein
LFELEELNLESNKITHISERVFSDSVDLKVLNLQSNEIVAFDKNTIVNLYWLEMICMYNNPITTQSPDQVNNVCPSITNPKCQVSLSPSC